MKVETWSSRGTPSPLLALKKQAVVNSTDKEINSAATQGSFEVDITLLMKIQSNNTLISALQSSETMKRKPSKAHLDLWPIEIVR